MGTDGKPGASMRALKDMLSQSHIYGADIDRDILFHEDRIMTSYVDQLDQTTFETMHKTFGRQNYNLIIDDGLHCIGANFNTLLFGLEHLADDGWIVIEDIALDRVDNWTIISYVLSNIDDLMTYLVKARSGYMFVVHKYRSI